MLREKSEKESRDEATQRYRGAVPKKNVEAEKKKKKEKKSDKACCYYEIHSVGECMKAGSSCPDEWRSCQPFPIMVHSRVAVLKPPASFTCSSAVH